MRNILASAFVSFALLINARAGQSVTLAWNPNTETNLAGYRLYWGHASRQYATHVEVPVPLTFVTVAVEPGTQYWFAVTAFATDGLESDYSDEVSYTSPGTAPDPAGPPPPPTLLVYSKEKGLLWWPVLAEYVDTLETTTDFVTWVHVLGPYAPRSGGYSYPTPAEGAGAFRLKRVRR